MPVLELKGPRLTLLPFDASCIGPVYLGWLQDPRVVRFSNQRFRRHTLESCAAYLSSFAGTDNLFLGLWLREEKKLIGTMTAYLATHHGTADLGILVGDPSSWGKGYGLEAWSLVLDYLLGERELRKVTGGTLRGNGGMVRIFERSGMHLEGVRVAQEIVEGQPMDALLYARFR